MTGDALDASTSLVPTAVAAILALQRTAGNVAVQRLFDSSSDAIAESTRRPLERRLGGDLYDAKVHCGSYADQVTRALGAKAVTVGRNMFFRAGEYDANSESGQRLIAHEAAHVVQQQTTGGSPSWGESGRHESAAMAFAAGGELSPVTAPAPAVQRQADDGSQPAAEEAPFPMARITVAGDPVEVDVEGGCDGLALHGQANATYDGGRGQVVGQKVTTSSACADCGDQQCLHVTGTLVTNYSASVAITMPPVPDGLSKCEDSKVRAWLRTVLLPHERDHEKRFKTYNGQTKNPVDITGCGKDDLQAQITAIQVAEDQQRQANANTLSGAIDPFTSTIDCSDCSDNS